MNFAASDIFDASEVPTERRPHASWYTPGLSDGLGDRLLMFDNGTASSLELLRFKREFSAAPGFESALRRRVDEFQRVRHPSLATVRTVEWLEEGEGLALVSNHTVGRRLSGLLQAARGSALAMELLQQLTPALAALEKEGGGIGHGALTADRIVVTPEGRLIIVEHVLGRALALLDLPATRLRSELGLAVPAGIERPEFDGRTDVLQLGFVALSLLVGRRIDPADDRVNLVTMFDEFTRTSLRGSSASPRLLLWLERALQLGGRTFRSAHEAHAALMKLPDEFEPQPAGPPRTALAFPTRAESVVAMSSNPRPDIPSQETTDDLDDFPAESTGSENDADAPPEETRHSSGPGAPPAHATTVEPPATAGRTGVVVAGLVALSIAEACVIGVLLYMRPVTGTAPVVVAAPAGAAPSTPAPSVEPNARAVHVPSPAPATVTVQKPPSAGASRPMTRPAFEAAPANRAAPPAGQFGGIKISSPIELQVFEAGSLVGSTAGPIALTEGLHTLDLVSDALGYRSRQNAEVKAGQMASLGISVPNGRISINASPWANVSIDGNPVGQTPLANLSVPLGSHEIVFQHPQLGEQRQTAVVKVDGLTRVSANLQR